MKQYNTIAESNNFIVLDDYTKHNELHAPAVAYQSESRLECEFIQDLVSQGYEYRPDISTPEALLANVRMKIQELNDMEFTDKEWLRFVEEYLDKPGDTLIDKTRKIHENHIYDFVFDDGHIKNIYLADKQNIARNNIQVINQFEQTGTQANRYDVTILVNGLPLVQIELKRRGVAVREAFNQVHRYSKESFNCDNSLFKYIQVYVISNGTDSRYFANTVERNKNSFDFTMNWARVNNVPIKDLKDFTETFLQKNTLLNVIFTYSVFDTNNTLLIMRPYQIAATERMLWKIRSAYQAKKWANTDGGGYIWHTTGSGKTLTSFKAARLATQLDFIDKVFFVVDRKDLDYQTMKEYQRFSPDSVNGSDSTAGLKRNIDKEDNKIIVTTIQKLNNLMKSEDNLPVYQKQVVFIFDECHRSQFGEAQKQLRKKFKKYYQFGFTGTPIFPDEIVNGVLVRRGNANGSETTASVFGRELHSYVITDAIRDEKVLKFKVDYNNVRPRFKDIETELDEQKLSAAENKQALLHPARINEISQYILQNFRIKTHRNEGANKGFNAMFAVSSVDAAKCYYEELNRLQKDAEKPLKIATIFSFAANEEQCSKGDIIDENFEPSAMDLSAKEFLTKAINDYNAMFGQSYGVDSKEFQNYYRDLAKRVKNKEVDLVIVVGMFLTGFDAPTLNTLFVDKNLRFHGLIQAFSRTNRIYDSTKTFGNIVTFRDLEQHTIDAIAMFGDEKTANFVLEKSYREYLEGFKDIASGEARKGYVEIVKDLNDKYPDTDNIVAEQDKKEFVKLFGEYLRMENILQNYDEYTTLKDFQKVDTNNLEAIETFKEEHFVTDDDIAQMQKVEMPSDRIIQDYKSTYNDIRDWLRREREGKKQEKSRIDWDDVTFEIDLLKSQEINLDYILELVFEHNAKKMDKASLIDEIRRTIRSSVGNRAKESMIVDFINQTNLDLFIDRADIIKAFYEYAQEELKKEASALIASENLNEKEAKYYIELSLKRRFASENGTDFNNILPKMSPLNPLYLSKKQTVFQKIVAFVDKFKEVGEKL
ncbi:MAG: type I restriction endonuclease subunit R [Bacteroidales bacterium]|nr:type I restriction endonuclease subunit R [Bacteroidales bacterium]